MSKEKKQQLDLGQPFDPYIVDQLNLRKKILSNPQYKEVEKKVEGDDSTITENVFDGYSKNERFGGANQEAFFTYTTEKQAFIRMMSAVDLDVRNADTHSPEIDKLLEIDLDENGERIHGKYSTSENARLDEFYLKHPTGLAKQYILEGGTRYYNDATSKNKGIRTGFTSGIFQEDTTTGFAYGDRDTRSNARDGFGVVPSPGIIDATIRTISDNGALREAQINFVCYNRRQLEILELLYMKPGYQICVEWGWNPYIIETKEGGIQREKNNFSVKDLFFQGDSETDAHTLNELMRYYNIKSGGNYDGFIGDVVNFKFSAREDGGYDCMTQIQSSNKLLESLTSQKISVTKDKEISTDFEYKSNLRYGNAWRANQIIDEMSTMREKEVQDKFIFALRGIQKLYSGTLEDLEKAKDTRSVGQIINDIKWANDMKEIQRQATEIRQDNTTVVNQTIHFDIEFLEKSQGNFNLPTDSAGNVIPYGEQVYGCTNPLDTKNYNPNANVDDGSCDQDIIQANLTKEAIKEENLLIDKEINHYLQGFNLVQNVVSQINKTQTADIIKVSVVGPLVEEVDATGATIYTEQGSAVLNSCIIKKTITNKHGHGSDEVYVRWDLLSQIINHLGIYHTANEDKQIYQPEPELSYMNSNQRVFVTSKKSKKIPMGTGNKKGSKFYVNYLAPTVEPEDPDFVHISGGDGQTQYKTKLVKGSKNEPHPLLGVSYDPNVCLMPHQKTVDFAFDNDKVDWLTSYELDEEISKNRQKIGLIYFNLNNLIKVYDKMKYQKEKELEKTVFRNLYKFNFFDYIKEIWDQVNYSTGNFYNFIPHTEHKRTHIVKIINYKFQQEYRPDIFKFEPQGLSSITRKFAFNSEITQDLASMISIAAKAPSNANEIEALNVKSFNRHIVHRFRNKALQEKTKISEAANKLIDDYVTYTDIATTLSMYMHQINQGDFQDFDVWFNEHKIESINPTRAIEIAQELNNLRFSIMARYPLKTTDGGDHPKRGLYKYDFSNNESSTAIPMKYSCELDGIAGIIPLQIFQIHESRLPFAYRRKDIAFQVVGETHKITAGQDWTTEIQGQMVFFKIDAEDKGKAGNEYEYEKREPIDQTKIESGLDPDMEVSGEAIEWLGSIEGYRENAYEDTVAPKYAIGYGTQYWYFDENGVEQQFGSNAPRVTLTFPKQPITKDQAMDNKMAYIRQVTIPLMRKNIKVRLTQTQFDAVASYAYNIPAGIGENSRFITKLNKGLFKEASEEIDVITAAGVVLPSLVKRRLQEQTLFMKGKYTSNATNAANKALWPTHINDSTAGGSKVPVTKYLTFQ